MDYIDPVVVAQKVVQGVYNGVTTVELDNLAAETAACMTTRHPDYATLAARIEVSYLHKETKKQFSIVIEDLYRYVNPKNGTPSSMISDTTYLIIKENEDVLNSAIIHSRDYSYNFFGFKTLERSYLLRIDGKVAERPQHMLMRVAVGIHGRDIKAVLESYHLMSQKYFTHASPTLYNAGTPRPSLSSCFLVQMQEDSIEGIYDTLKQCALISKSAGGIGVHVHCIRATGSYIAGTNGRSNGLVPMLRVFNNTARYVDQGGNKRPGAFAIYLEPWHADVFEYLDLRKNTGNEEWRARDLFYALWVPDLFMQRVEVDGNWSLFCPAEAPGLHEKHNAEFVELYTQYEKEGRARRVIPARQLWAAILDAQIETGTPFIVYKDACNRKSNQQHLGTIKCSNLCTEIVEFTSKDETAVCNLASLSLPAFIFNESNDSEVNLTENEEECYGAVPTSNSKCLLRKTASGTFFFDFGKLYEVTKVVTRNLNRVIDVNYYPVPEARRSNMRHRPIGIGVQGLADAFMILGMAFDDDDARKLNRDIFETIYFAALNASCDLAIEEGVHESYPGSPMSQGKLQFDMWGASESTFSGMWDWTELRQRILAYGVRNSLLLAPMPTASTSQILGNNECFEPYTSNMYSRRVLAGEFQVVNPHLLHQLVDAGLWNESVKNQLTNDNGSIQAIEGIPNDIKHIYRTVWEIPQRSIVDMAADRGIFIDQSQSLNIHIAEPTAQKLTSMHFHGWSKGLKTGMYYLRTRPAAEAIKFTVDHAAVRRVRDTTASTDSTVDLTCSIANKFDCTMCSG